MLSECFNLIDVYSFPFVIGEIFKYVSWERFDKNYVHSIKELD